MAPLELHVTQKTAFPDLETINATEAAIIRIQDLTRNPLAVHSNPGGGYTIETPEDLEPRIRSILANTNLQITEG